MTIAPEWFARVGTPIDDRDRDDIAAIMRIRGIGHAADIVLARNWYAADAWINSDQSAASWDDDEDERERLWLQLAEEIPESELLARLATIVEVAAPAVRAAAASAAAREFDTAPDLIDTATAAALLCLHQHALAELAGIGDEHPFARKYALFARGRWPLGYQAGRYGVY